MTGDCPESSRAALVLRDHNFLTGTVATAILYGYARVNVSLFALSAGIQPSDLDLGTEDYLFLAVLWAVMLATCFGFFVAQQRSITKAIEEGVGLLGGLGQHVFGVVALSAFTVASVALFPGLSLLAGVLIVLASPLVAVGVVYVVGRFASIALRPMSVGLISASLFLLVSSAAGAIVAGERLDDKVQEPPSLPLPLHLVLTPSEGLVDLGQTECVWRLAPRVVVSDGSIVVLTEPVRFASAAGCLASAL